MDLPGNHPMVSPKNSMDIAWANDTPIAKHIKAQSQLIAKKINRHLCNMNTNALYIKKRTEKLLWHQCLGHPCDEYLYKAGKAVKGVPTFSFMSTILDTCPIYIRAKQTKVRKQATKIEERITKGHTPCASHSTKRAEHPYQGLSIDFSFSGMSSSNSEQQQDYKGIRF